MPDVASYIEKPWPAVGPFSSYVVGSRRRFREFLVFLWLVMVKSHIANRGFQAICTILTTVHGALALVRLKMNNFRKIKKEYRAPQLLVLSKGLSFPMMH